MCKGQAALRFVFRSLLVVVFPACMLCGAVAHAQQTAFDLEGQPVDPIARTSGKAVVLIFLRQDCPVSNRYAPVIQQISARYENDARFFLVYPDKLESAQMIREYLAAYGYHLPALRDPQHALVKRAKAEITPEAAVFDRNGKLIYHGRIDNWYVEFGNSRPAPTTHELIDAISAAIAGKSVAESFAKGVGCYISDLQ